jgi:hypothetical protein
LLVPRWRDSPLPWTGHQHLPREARRDQDVKESGGTRKGFTQRRQGTKRSSNARGRKAILDRGGALGDPRKLRLRIAAPAAMPMALRVFDMRFRAVHSMRLALRAWRCAIARCIRDGSGNAFALCIQANPGKSRLIQRNHCLWLVRSRVVEGGE